MVDCVFCKIAEGKVPTKILTESETVIAFSDIKPSADTHILIVPKKHIETVMDIKLADSDLLGEMISVAQELIREKGLSKKYRLVFNGGSLQVVPHIHLHLLGGNFKRKNNDK